jgi:hypothetical protein
MLKFLAMILVAAAVGCIWKGKSDNDEKLGLIGVILCVGAMAVYLIDWLVLGN